MTATSSSESEECLSCSSPSSSTTKLEHDERLSPETTHSQPLACSDFNVESLTLTESSSLSSHSKSANRSTTSSDCNEFVQATLDRVNWDALLEITSRVLHVDQSEAPRCQWGRKISGSFNLVRFVHRNDETIPAVVVRVPLLPEGEVDPGIMQSLETKYASEIATMTYIYKNVDTEIIPVPEVLSSSISIGNSDVGTPFMILTKVDGVPLCDIWDTMKDDARDVVLRQVVKIYLELYKHKLPGIGVLMQSGTKEWRIEPAACLDTPAKTKDALNRVFVNGLYFWVQRATATMQEVADEYFGTFYPATIYAHLWFLRAMLPAFLDTRLDLHGFPIVPGDFHSQNILISFPDGPESPCITGVIDWERTTTDCTSAFAQYPFFIVDPPWDKDGPFHIRNVRDQKIFLKMMKEEETSLCPSAPPILTDAFSRCKGIYLILQCITDPDLIDEHIEELFELLYGHTEGVEDAVIWPLESGILSDRYAQWKLEKEVLDEAVLVHSELKSPLLSRDKFIAFARARRDTFPPGGKVETWLCTLPAQSNDTLVSLG